MKDMKIVLITIGLLSLILSGCASEGRAQGGIQASGTISADLVSISPQMNENVLAVNAEEGQSVNQGEVLFIQDNALLQAQHEQAQAQVATAVAAVEAAQAQLAAAQAQYDLLLQSARQQDSQLRSSVWQTEALDEMDKPSWYFQKSEELAAALAEEDAAEAALEKAKANLAKVLNDASNDDFIAAEQRLAAASKDYQAWTGILEEAQAALDNGPMEDAAQDHLDSARTELDAAQLNYNRMLTSAAAEDVLEERARVAVVQARLDLARAETARLQTGDDSLQVQASKAQVQQAEKAVAQAMANKTQAEASLRLITLHLNRAEVKAPVDGTVLTRNVEPGEFAAAGSTVMTIGKLDQVRLVVYVPEDQYALIQVSQNVSVSVDSYPGRVFNGQVTAIADQAEFTPRNVSTVEGRKSTVYAVEILLPNPDRALKPGMPAQVQFAE